MNWREGVSIVLIVLVTSSSGLVQLDRNLSSTNESVGYGINTDISSDVSYDSAVDISSDEAFALQGWPGNGSESSPYLISNLRFSYPDQEPIIIENTRAYFIVRNCVFEIQGMPPVNGCTNAFSIFNVSNGVIEDCSISTRSLGIGISNSSDMMIQNNLIIDSEHGILLGELERSVLYNNSIYSRYIGIHTDGPRNCNFTGNLIVESEFGFTLGEFSINNTISQNRIGWCGDTSASDYGSGNKWDGNSWSDWDGVGPYIIDGPAGSADDSPKLFDDDVLGPIIEFDRPLGLLDSTGLFTFSIIVSDVSGVDSVLVFIRESWWIDDEIVRSNWSDYVMHPSEFPNNYTFSLQTSDCWSLSFIVLANDTLGHSRMSDMDSFEVNPRYPSFPPPFPPPPPIYFPGGIIVLGILVVIIIVNKRSKSTPSPGILKRVE